MRMKRNRGKKILYLILDSQAMCFKKTDKRLKSDSNADKRIPYIWGGMHSNFLILIYISVT